MRAVPAGWRLSATGPAWSAYDKWTAVGFAGEMGWGRVCRRWGEARRRQITHCRVRPGRLIFLGYWRALNQLLSDKPRQKPLRGFRKFIALRRHWFRKIDPAQWGFFRVKVELTCMTIIYPYSWRAVEDLFRAGGFTTPLHYPGSQTL